MYYLYMYISYISFNIAILLTTNRFIADHGFIQFNLML